jgi:hypothetical protein
LSAARPGHGDHWLAALDQGDPRLRDVLSPPLDAPEPLTTHRAALTEALDIVQVTARRRLVTAFPEPRATALVHLRPRELLLWETRVEGWLVAEHEAAGALTFFLTDLADNAERYQKARGVVALEVGGLGYALHRVPSAEGPSRLRPARERDARFLPDDYTVDADVRDIHPAGGGEVLDLAFQGDLVLPIALRQPTALAPGDRAHGYLWLTARWPEEQPSSTPPRR